jgi:hypothetical protein
MQLRKIYRPFALVCFLILSLFSARNGFAQLSSASINGVVRDPSGAVIPKTTLSLHNVDTSEDFTSQADVAGVYTFLHVAPGRYTLKATATGFSVADVPVFTLTVSQIATIDFSLKIGSTSAEVVVQDTTAQLDTSSANLGTVIQTRQVNDLPLNGRNFSELLLLTPGVSTANTGQNVNQGASAATQGASFLIPIVNGQTSRSDNFLMDGFNDDNTEYGGYAIPPILDSIQEFKVVSHPDSAEFGSVLGGVINVATKSGTNQLHGSLWSYYRDQIFDARSYFLPDTTPKTPYHQNQFGASSGGPVLLPKLYNGKNKTFFFGAYQGFRYTRGGESFLRVPTAAQLAGDESEWPTQIYNPYSTRPNPADPGTFIRDPFPQNQIPSSLIDSRAVNYAKLIFPAAGPVLDAAGDNLIDTGAKIQTQNEFTIRIDQKIGANDSAFFRYSFINSVYTSESITPFTSVNSTPARQWGGSYVHVFSPSLALQGQFGHTYGNFNVPTISSVSAAAFAAGGFAPGFAGNYASLGGPDTLIPYPGITGYYNPGELYEISHDIESYEARSTLTKTLATHTLTFGGSYFTIPIHFVYGKTLLSFTGQPTSDTNPNDPSAPGDPFSSYLLNVPSTANRQDDNYTLRSGRVLSFFGQDSWKVNDRLTLNVGLRYDVTFLPLQGAPGSQGVHGGIDTGAMDFRNGTYILQKGGVPGFCSVVGQAPCIPGSALPQHVIVDQRGRISYNDYTNFGPRLGAAFRPDQKTVASAGFGVFYDNSAANAQLATQFLGQWPDIGNLVVSSLNVPTAVSPTPTVPMQSPFGVSIFPAATPFSPTAAGFDPHNRTPMSLQWNAGVERDLGWDTIIKLNYVGSRGIHLLDESNYNTALTPGPGAIQSRALWNYIGVANWFESRAFNSYNAFQFSLEKHVSNGFSALVSYTWSKNINQGNDEYLVDRSLGTCQQPYDLNSYGCRGLAASDLPQFLSAAVVYELPFGRGKSFSTGNRVFDYLLGNWQANSIFVARSGAVFTPYVSSDIANTGNGIVYANLVGNPNSVQRNAAHWFNPAAYAVPPLYTFGSASRNSLRGPSYWDLDGSLFRQIPIGEGREFQFRAEAFNLLNNVDLGNPNAILGTTGFGAITTTANTSREIQLALKFIF